MLVHPAGVLLDLDLRREADLVLDNLDAFFLACRISAGGPVVGSNLCEGHVSLRALDTIRPRACVAASSLRRLSTKDLPTRYWPMVPVRRGDCWAWQTQDRI